MDRMLSVFINRNYLCLWMARTISIAGDMVLTAAIVVWIGLVVGRGQAWAPFAVSAVLVAAALPSIMLGPVAGVFADRWDRRRTMLVTDAGRFVLLVALVPFMGSALPIVAQFALITAAVFLISAADQLFRPASTGMIATIVDEPFQTRALGLGQASMSLAMIVGPAIAAPLVLGLGIRWAILVDAISFFASFAGVRAIKLPSRGIEAMIAGARSFGSNLGDGVRFLLATPTLTVLIVALSIAMLGGSALNTLDVFFLTRNLHAPGSAYGLLDAVFAIGAVIGGVLSASLGERIGPRRMVSYSLLALGLAVVIYSRLSAFPPAAGLLFLCGVPMAALQVGAGSLIMRATPKAMIGRVSAMMDPVVVLASLAGAAASGYFDGGVLREFHAAVFGMRFGPVDTIFLGAGILVVLAGVYAIAGLRGRQPERRGEAGEAEKDVARAG